MHSFPLLAAPFSPAQRRSLSLVQGGEGVVERTMRASFLVSADMAHALHPNYADVHDPQHQASETHPTTLS